MNNLILKRTLLSEKLKYKSVIATLILVGITAIISAAALNPLWNVYEFIQATPSLVFSKLQFYRLWTTLFAHAGLEHLLSNMLLFIPFSLYLINYYGSWFFPIEGILVGGIINYFVLKTLPTETALIGISGVVHWMGAAWITLFFFVERKINPIPRFIKALGVALILFVPNALSANVSYFSHLLGFIFGIISGFLFYLRHKKQIRSHDIYEEILTEIDELPQDFEVENPPNDYHYLH